MKNPIFVVSLVLLLCFTISCQNKAEKTELEKFRTQAKLEEQNKALMLRAVEEWNKGSNEFFMDNAVPDYAYYSPSGKAKPMSREEVDENFKTTKKRFPDLRFTIEELVAEGDKLATRFSFTGTHQGEFMGIPATGNRIEVSGLIISLIKNGKFVEDREETDILGMMMQLGMELKPKEAEKK
jgi:predicted ester cyclase